VVIIFVQGGVVIEVLLDMDERVVITCEKLADTSGVFRLVARYTIASEKRRKTCDIECQRIERTTALRYRLRY
jgi:hypothetical protein